MKRLAAHLFCVVSFFAMLLSDSISQVRPALTCQTEPVKQIECVPPPIYMQRACSKCFGATFHIIVDCVQPEFVMHFKCDYCGHELPVGRMKEK